MRSNQQYVNRNAQRAGAGFHRQGNALQQQHQQTVLRQQAQMQHTVPMLQQQQPHFVYNTNQGVDRFRQHHQQPFGQFRSQSVQPAPASSNNPGGFTLNHQSLDELPTLSQSRNFQTGIRQNGIQQGPQQPNRSFKEVLLGEQQAMMAMETQGKLLQQQRVVPKSSQTHGNQLPMAHSVGQMMPAQVEQTPRCDFTSTLQLPMPSHRVAVSTSASQVENGGFADLTVEDDDTSSQRSKNLVNGIQSKDTRRESIAGSDDSIPGNIPSKNGEQVALAPRGVASGVTNSQMDVVSNAPPANVDYMMQMISQQNRMLCQLSEQVATLSSHVMNTGAAKGFVQSVFDPPDLEQSPDGGSGSWERQRASMLGSHEETLLENIQPELRPGGTSRGIFFDATPHGSLSGNSSGYGSPEMTDGFGMPAGEGIRPSGHTASSRGAASSSSREEKARPLPGLALKEKSNNLTRKTQLIAREVRSRITAAVKRHTKLTRVDPQLLDGVIKMFPNLESIVQGGANFERYSNAMTDLDVRVRQYPTWQSFLSTYLSKATSATKLVETKTNINGMATALATALKTLNKPSQEELGENVVPILKAMRGQSNFHSCNNALGTLEKAVSCAGGCVSMSSVENYAAAHWLVLQQKLLSCPLEDAWQEMERWTMKHKTSQLFNRQVQSMMTNAKDIQSMCYMAAEIEFVQNQTREERRTTLDANSGGNSGIAIEDCDIASAVSLDYAASECMANLVVPEAKQRRMEHALAHYVSAPDVNLLPSAATLIKSSVGYVDFPWTSSEKLFAAGAVGVRSWGAVSWAELVTELSGMNVSVAGRTILENYVFVDHKSFIPFPAEEVSEILNKISQSVLGIADNGPQEVMEQFQKAAEQWTAAQKHPLPLLWMVSNGDIKAGCFWIADAKKIATDDWSGLKSKIKSGHELPPKLNNQLQDEQNQWNAEFKWYGTASALISNMKTFAQASDVSEAIRTQITNEANEVAAKLESEKNALKENNSGDATKTSAQEIVADEVVTEMAVLAKFRLLTAKLQADIDSGIKIFEDELAGEILCRERLTSQVFCLEGEPPLQLTEEQVAIVDGTMGAEDGDPAVDDSIENPVEGAPKNATASKKRKSVTKDDDDKDAKKAKKGHMGLAGKLKMDIDPATNQRPTYQNSVQEQEMPGDDDPFQFITNRIVSEEGGPIESDSATSSFQPNHAYAGGGSMSIVNPQVVFEQIMIPSMPGEIQMSTHGAEAEVEGHNPFAVGGVDPDLFGNQ